MLSLIHCSTSGDDSRKLGKGVWGARVVQWWEHSPPSNVARVRILASTPYVGWVCCWFSPLLQEVFLWVLRFSPLLENQHFQLPIRSGTHGHVSASSYDLLSAPWVNKLQFTISILQAEVYSNQFTIGKRPLQYSAQRYYNSAYDTLPL